MAEAEEEALQMVGKECTARKVKKEDRKSLLELSLGELKTKSGSVPFTPRLKTPAKT